LTFDAKRSRLFMSRRAAGVTVYDVQQKRVLGTISDSEDSNATTLVEEFNRGYTTNEDGTTTVFDLTTLETLARTSFGSDGDAGVYEPITKQVVFKMSDGKALVFVDAKTGAIGETLAMPSAKLDGSVADEAGHIFVAQRDRNSLARIDARSRRLELEWPIAGCSEPTGLAFDAQRHRLFVGCRSQNPVLAIVNGDDGQVLETHAIGRGNDGVIYDADTREIFTSNGVDGNLVVFKQLDADHYELTEATTTRPYARTMALDPATKKLYLVTAEGTVDVTKPVLTSVAPFYPNRYYTNTFTVLTYARTGE
jgi:DNA-binding beta-propeller fold protein YncE